MPGLPVPQGSMRLMVTHAGPRVVHEDGHRLKAWRRQIVEAIRAGRLAPFGRGEPVKVKMTFVLLRPGSVSAGRRPRPTVKPDVDKLERAVLDALTESRLIWDDAQIVDVRAIKRYDVEPGLDVESAGVTILAASLNPQPGLL